MIHTAGAAILAFLRLTLAVGAESYGNAIASNASAENVVGVISSFGNFTILVQGLEEARLNSALEGPGPYTVFTPSNHAFSMLPSTMPSRPIDHW